MLRRAVLMAGGLSLTAGIVALVLSRGAAGWILLINGLLITGGVLFDAYRYKPDLLAAPGPGWVPTSEKTADEQGVVTVWFNPATGQRAYVRGEDRRHSQ